MTTRQETSGPSATVETPAVRTVTVPARPEPADRPVAIRTAETVPSGPGVFDTGPAPSKTTASDRPAPTVRHRHLAAFATAVPVSGAAGFIATIVDATTTAIVLAAVVAGGLAARWLLPRLLAWATAAIAAVTGRGTQ